MIVLLEQVQVGGPAGKQGPICDVGRDSVEDSLVTEGARPQDSEERGIMLRVEETAPVRKQEAGSKREQQ